MAEVLLVKPSVIFYIHANQWASSPLTSYIEPTFIGDPFKP